MPVDISVVDAQMRAIGVVSTFGTKKEVRELPRILSPGENIRGMASGFMDGNTWLITVTDRRIILLDKGMIYGLKQLELPISQIKSVTSKVGLVFGEILIDTGGQTQKMENMQKVDAPKIANIISELVHCSGVATPVTPANGSGGDLLGQLERLAALKDKDLISDEEFAAAKKKILET